MNREKRRGGLRESARACGRGAADRQCRGRNRVFEHGRDRSPGFRQRASKRRRRPRRLRHRRHASVAGRPSEPAVHRGVIAGPRRFRSKAKCRAGKTSTGRGGRPGPLAAPGRKCLVFSSSSSRPLRLIAA